jgi:stage V sporulation protein AD
MKIGYQSWTFDTKPVIIGNSAVVGPFEAQGPLAGDFDMINGDIWVGQDSFEKAEKRFLEQACEIAIRKAQIKKEDVEFFISGDLMNQIISSSFAARTIGSPFFGIFGACSSSIEGLILASLIIDSKFGNNVLAAASSHNAAAEKQFRYPTEYGAQKPPTAQWTVTGAGAALLSNQGEGLKVTSATIGRVIDMGISDPFNMGVAMAPAAVDTIQNHFKDLGRQPDYYDFIVTGDLGGVGYNMALDILKEQGMNIGKEKFSDCGLLIYSPEQPVMSGGSGCGCSAVVTYGHLFKRMIKGELKKILVVATGALMSPMSYQQKESIPGIAHAVSIEI